MIELVILVLLVLLVGLFVYKSEVAYNSVVNGEDPFIKDLRDLRDLAEKAKAEIEEDIEAALQGTAPFDRDSLDSYFKNAEAPMVLMTDTVYGRSCSIPLWYLCELVSKLSVCGEALDNNPKKVLDKEGENI